MGNSQVSTSYDDMAVLIRSSKKQLVPSGRNAENSTTSPMQCAVINTENSHGVIDHVNPSAWDLPVLAS